MVGKSGIASVLDDEYEVLGELGRGAMGIVLRARHRQLDRLVAIKELPASFAADKVVRTRFLDEAQTVARLDHPHIVVVHDFVDRDGHLALVMEQLPGGTVWDTFIDEGVTPARAVGLILSTAAGVHHAHERGVLHRDIKPENLMFAADGQVKVTDFGIAKMLTGEETMATDEGEILGTPAYMAPEQAEGGDLGPQADVYACGIMLYELLTGDLPQGGNSVVELLDQRISRDAPPLADRAPHIPAAVATVVDRSLSRSPHDRWQSAEEMAVALGSAAATAWGPSWLEQVGVSVRGADSIERASRTTTGTADSATGVSIPESATPASVGELAPPASRSTATASPATSPGAVDPRATRVTDEPADAPRAARETVVVDTGDSAPPEPPRSGRSTTVIQPDEPQPPEDMPGVAGGRATRVLDGQRPIVAASPVRTPPVDLRTVAPSELVRVRDIRSTPSPLPLLAAAIVGAVVAAAIVVLGIGAWPSPIGEPAAIGTAHETIVGVQSVDFTEDIRLDNVAGNAEVTLTNRLFGIVPLGSAQASSAGGEAVIQSDASFLRFTTGGPVVSELSIGDDAPFATLPVQPSNRAWFATVPAVVSVVVLLWGVSLVGSNLRPLRRGTVRVGAYLGLAFSGAVTAASAGLLAMVARVTDAGSAETLIGAAIAGAIAALFLGEWRRRSGLRRRLKRFARAMARG